MTDVSAADMAAAVDALVEHVRRHGDITHPKAVQFVCDRLGLRYSGDLELYSALFPSIVLLAGVSQDAIDVNEAIRREKRLTPSPLGNDRDVLMVYGMDGSPTLRLPLVTAPPPDGGFKKPHWMPLLFKVADPPWH